VELWGRTPNRDDAEENFCGAFKIYDVDGQLVNFACSAMAEVLRSGQPQLNREAIIKRPDGSQVRVLANIEPLRDEQGKLVGAVDVFHDISDQNQSAAVKQESGPQLRSIVDNVVDGIITIDEHGTVESLNRAAEAIFGYPASEVVGHNVRMLMPPPYREEHDGYIARYLETGQAKIIGIGREVVGLRRDGTTFPMDLAVSEFSLQGRRYFTGIVRDISERKRTEEALHRSEERFRQLAENVTDVFYVADARDLQMLYISPAYEQVCGRTRHSLDEMPGLFMETVHPDDRERVKSSIDRLRRGEVMQEEYRIRRADGSTRWIWDRGFPVRNTSGEVIRVAGIAEDITDRRRMGAVSFGTEAGIYQAAGIPAIVCGPGDIARAHRPNEFILREELMACMTAFERLGERLTA
jgi:PAS domain S-box-containing protein